MYPGMEAPEQRPRTAPAPAAGYRTTGADALEERDIRTGTSCSLPRERARPAARCRGSPQRAARVCPEHPEQPDTGPDPRSEPAAPGEPRRSRSRAAAALAPPGAAGQNRTRSAARGRASADSRGPCTEPQGRRHPKTALWTTAAAFSNFTSRAWHVCPQEKSISPNHSWGRALLLLSCPQPVETLIQLNLNRNLEMPEQRSEAAAQGSPQGVGKQGLSRVPMDHFCSLSGTQRSTTAVCAVLAQGLMGQSLGHHSPAQHDASSIPCPAPRAAPSHAQLPGLLSPVPTQPNKMHKRCFVLQPRAGQTGPIILIKEIKPCIDFSPGWRKAVAVKALHNPFTQHRATLPSL